MTAAERARAVVAAWTIRDGDGLLNGELPTLNAGHRQRLVDRIERALLAHEAAVRAECEKDVEMRVHTAINAGCAVGRAGAELEHIDREAWKIALDEAHRTILQEREAEVREECAKIAERRFPRGGAHTYASENADRYIALEDAAEEIAAAIRAAARVGGGRRSGKE